MPLEITWQGHGSWTVASPTHTIQIDPFFDDNPAAKIRSDNAPADFILVSHGHFDHVADAAKIANRTGAMVVANYEIASWLAKQGVNKTLGMNLGGWAKLPFGRVKLTLAFHSSQLPDGSDGGSAGGFLLEIGGKRLYFACDTALFGDMRLIGGGGLDLAVLPIGDLFTMGPDDALDAVKLLEPKRVAPSHFGTWPPIAQDANAWAERVRRETQAEPIVLEPGKSMKL